jgi:hypothetical protein
MKDDAHFCTETMPGFSGRHLSDYSTGHQELELDICKMFAWLLCAPLPLHLDLMIKHGRSAVP